MSWLDLFRPKKQEPKRKVEIPFRVPCDTSELFDLIVRWTDNEGWAPAMFLCILKEVGIPNPQKFCNMDKEDDSFDCQTAEGTVRISLCFGDPIDFCSEVWIGRGERTEHYKVWERSDEPGKAQIKREATTIQKDGKELYSFYCEFCCHRTLRFGDKHILRVEIAEPDKQNKQGKALHNADLIEEYLMELEEPISAQKVYSDVIQLLEYTMTDIQMADKILVSYNDLKEGAEDDRNQETTRSIVYKKKGQMQEYGVLENGETFVVCKNGDWHYIGPVAKINFCAETAGCSVALENSSLDTLQHLQVNDLMQHAGNKVSQLWRFLK